MVVKAGARIGSSLFGDGAKATKNADEILVEGGKVQRTPTGDVVSGSGGNTALRTADEGGIPANKQQGESWEFGIITIPAALVALIKLITYISAIIIVSGVLTGAWTVKQVGSKARQRLGGS